MDNPENKPENPNEAEVHNKTLKWVLIGSISLILLVLAFFLVIDSIRHIKYDGTDFEVQKEGQIIIYKTAFPVYSSITGKHIADYNFYLRNDPRKLEDIQVYGRINTLNPIVINMTEDFNCDGDGVIAIANFAQSFNALGSKVIKDPKAKCDPKGTYTFVQIRAANETSIVQYGDSCYYINVNNCEILRATEKFMLEKITSNQNKKIIMNQ